MTDKKSVDKGTEGSARQSGTANADPIEQGGIPRQYDRQPDPGEPWRYLTPCCERHPKGKKKTRKFECPGCWTCWRKDELIDKKTRPSERDDA